VVNFSASDCVAGRPGRRVCERDELLSDSGQSSRSACVPYCTRWRSMPTRVCLSQRSRLLACVSIDLVSSIHRAFAPGISQRDFRMIPSRN